MSPLWAIPVVVLLIGTAAMFALVRAAMDEARELGREAARFGDLRPALVALQEDVARARATVEGRPRQ